MNDAVRVLVVGDDATDREVFTTILVGDGYVVSTAACAVALAAVFRSRPHLILVDRCHAHAAAAFAAAYLETPDAHAPMLLISAGPEAAVRMTAGAIGAAGYVACPFEPEALRAAAARLTRAVLRPPTDDSDEVGSRRYLHRLADELATLRAEIASAAATRTMRPTERGGVLTVWDVARRRAARRELAQQRLQLDHLSRELAARRGPPWRG